MNIWSALRILMAWCFSTRASVATVLSMYSCISRHLRVKSAWWLMVDWSANFLHKIFYINLKFSICNLFLMLRFLCGKCSVGQLLLCIIWLTSHLYCMGFWEVSIKKKLYLNLNIFDMELFFSSGPVGQQDARPMPRIENHCAVLLSFFMSVFGAGWPSLGQPVVVFSQWYFLHQCQTYVHGVLWNWHNIYI